MKILSNGVWEVFLAELHSKDELLRKAYERIDRLTEAIAHKQNIPIVMPQAELPKFVPAITLERSPGWFDNKRPNPPAGEPKQ